MAQLRPTPRSAETPVPPQIPYASPGTPKRTAWTAKRIVNAYVPTLVLLAAVHGMMIVLVPRFESMFADFKLELPAATKALLGVSRAYRGGGWIPVSAGLLLLPLGWIAVTGPRTRDRAYRMSLTLMTGALVVWVVVGIFLPMLTLIDGISSAKGK